VSAVNDMATVYLLILFEILIWYICIE